MPAVQKLTIREQFAVIAQIHADGDISPQVLYRLAYSGSLEAVEALADLPASASRWWRSRKVQDFYQQQKAVIDAKKAAERKVVESEVRTRIEAVRDKALDDSGLVDYSDQRNQLRKLNEIISSATDPSEALDALKVMITKQQQIVPEDDENNPRKKKQVRFYRPIVCTREENGGCPLYSAANNTFRMLAGNSMESREPTENIRILESLLNEKRGELEAFAVSWVERRIEYERKRLTR